MRKEKLLLILLLISTISVFAQDYKGKAKLRGYVFDEDNKPLEGVKIKLFSLKAQSGFELETNTQGKWQALFITGKTWHVDFEKEGYLPKKLNVNVYEHNENPPILIKLKKIDGIILSDELKSKLKEGNGLYDHNKFLEAITAYETILAEYPDSFIISKNIGNCFFQLEKYDQATEAYKRVLEKDPGNYEIMLLLGNSNANQGAHDRALEWYRKIKFEKIKDPAVLYNIASTFFSNSHLQEAIKYYQKAVEIQNDFLDAIYQLGLVYLSMGNKPHAINAFEDYLKYDTDSKRATQVKGFIELLNKS